MLPDIYGAVIINRMGCKGNRLINTKRTNSFIRPRGFAKGEIIKAYDYDLKGRIITTSKEPP